VNAAPQIRIALVDDQMLIRSAVAQLLGAESDMTVVGEARNGREALALVETTRPDIVLMDIRMPIMDGIEATGAISAHPELSGTRIIVLTTFEEDEYVVKALRAGASGFLGKSTDAPELTSAVRVVHAGEALLSPAATRALVDRWLASPDDSVHGTLPALQDLTPRETEVLVLVASGLSNTEIAAHLVLSVHTAKTHVSRIMMKLSAHDRAQLVIAAYESGLVERSRER